MANGLSVRVVDDLGARAEQAAESLTMCIHALIDGEERHEDILLNSLDLIRDRIEKLAADIRTMPVDAGERIRSEENASSFDLSEDERLLIEGYRAADVHHKEDMSAAAARAIERGRKDRKIVYFA